MPEASFKLVFSRNQTLWVLTLALSTLSESNNSMLVLADECLLLERLLLLGVLKSVKHEAGRLRGDGIRGVVISMIDSVVEEVKMLRGFPWVLESANFLVSSDSSHVKVL